MRQRNGFTLIELLVATVMLVIIITGTARFAGDFSRTINGSTIRVVATGVATDRLEQVRSDPRYSQLATLYGSGAGADTTGFPGFPKMRRVTKVINDKAGGRDLMVITIRVMAPTLRDTVSLTTVVASP